MSLSQLLPDALQLPLPSCSPGRTMLVPSYHRLQCRRRLQAICAAHAQLVPVLAGKLAIWPPEADTASAFPTIAHLGLNYVVPFAPPVLVDPLLVAFYILRLQHSWEVGLSWIPGNLRGISGAVQLLLHSALCRCTSKHVPASYQQACAFTALLAK